MFRRVARSREVNPSTNLGAPGLHRDLGRRSHSLGTKRCKLSCRDARSLVGYQQCDYFHFITFSCYHRQPAFLGKTSARNLFEAALERIRARYQMVVAGYVVMPEHVSPGRQRAPKRIAVAHVQAVKLSVARRSAERPFWQARHYDFNVWTAEKVTEKLNYVHRNPVTRGLVAKQEDWPWSSFRHYATGEIGKVEIESMWTAARRRYEFLQDSRLRNHWAEGCAIPGL